MTDGQTNTTDPATLRTQMDESTRRALIFWASRWAIGLGGAIAIVLYSGDHHWLPIAAGLVALVSLGIIFLNRSGMQKRIAAAEAAQAERDES